MKKLSIGSGRGIYKDITQQLDPYKEGESEIFVVEGTIEKPVVGIRYPGKKVKRRELKRPNKNSALWANLFDFEVVPYDKNGNEFVSSQFTFTGLLEDYAMHKRKDNEFWERLQEIYENENLSKEPPKLPGIESRLYLLMLKWIWIQEDFNYKFKWDEVGSPTKYRLETRTGTVTARGAGRDKFYAALVLLRHGFTVELIKKIIPLY